MLRLLQLPVRSEDVVSPAPTRTIDATNQSLRPPLFVVEQIRRMRGGSQSHLMRCRSDDYYIVKFQGNPQGTRILVNELLGTMLAARMGLPTTPVAICHVSEGLIRLTPDLCFQIAGGRIPCLPGLQFGSRYVGDPRNAKVLDDLLLPDYELARVKNVTDFVGMLVFDKWTCNTDGRQTLFIQTEGGYEAVMVDQGMCFNSSGWNFPDAPLRGLYARHVVYGRVHGMDDFEPWLTKLDEITESVLMEIAKKTPSEWYGGDWGALQRLLEQLDRRRRRVRELIWETWRARPCAFPHWIEGIVAPLKQFGKKERRQWQRIANKNRALRLLVS